MKIKQTINRSQNSSLVARNNILSGFLVVIMLMVSVSVVSVISSQGAQTAQAAIAKQLNFQGKLTANSNGTNVADGQYSFQFRLYDALSGGSLLWTETYDQGSGACEQLQVTNGIFNAKLGSCNSLAGINFGSGGLYLSVNFDSGSGYDGEMSPRKQLVASAFSFVSNSLEGDGIINIENTTATQASIGYDNSNKLEVGVSATGFTTLTAVGSGAGFNLTGGNVGIGTSSVSARLHVTATTEQLRLAYDNSNYSSLTVSSSGDLVIAPSGGNVDITGDLLVSGLSGSGTRCVQVNNSGLLAVAGAACGSGGSAWNDLTAPTGNLTLAHGSNTTTMTFNGVTTGTAWTQSSTSITSGALHSLSQSSSTFTGNGLLMNFANGSGSFTGNFADFQVNGTSRFKVGSGTVTTSGSSAVAGVLQDVVLTNGTASGFQFGNRLLNTVNGGTAGTHVGQFIRMTDSTSLSSGQIVRGLEVQAYSGTNNNGINTGIATYGKTFGIQAETTAQAGAVSQPAAVFAYLNQASGQEAVGNAIRAYSNTLTSANLVSLYHETSTFTGSGLIMNFGNNSGSFTGNFLNLQKAGSSKFTVSHEGIVNLNLNGTATTNGLCHSGANVNTATDTQRDVVACSAAPGDIAEWYETTAGVEAGDIVSITNQTFTYSEKNFNAWTGMQTGTNSTHTIAVLTKSLGAYDQAMMGVVSTSPYKTFGQAVRDAGAQNPQPVALKGRVLVKVTSENGTIQAGDYITTSATQAGRGMKATRPGMVIGQALQSDNGSGKVMVFVQSFYYDPTVFVDASGNVILQRNTATTSLVASTETQAAYIIDQQGSGDILHLQQNGSDRMLIQNNGTVNINVQPVGAEDIVLDVKSAETSVFAINARGDAIITGVLIMKDDSFAGSIATVEDGTAEIEFTYHLGKGKPVVQLTVESDQPTFAQIKEFKKDNFGRYTGFVIKTYGLNGSTTSAVVHYNVIAKPGNYDTYGQVVLSVNDSGGNSSIGSNGSGGSGNSDGNSGDENSTDDNGETGGGSENSSPPSDLGGETSGGGDDS